MMQSTWNRRAVRGALLLALALAAPPAAAGGDPKEAIRPEEKAAIRGRMEQFLKALAGGNAKEVTGFWTAQGEYQHGGHLTIRGRANIEKAYAEFLKKKQPGVPELEHDAVRFLAEDTAIQDGAFVVNRPNPAEQGRHRFSALWVRVQGQWHLGLLREWPEGPSLQELAWLVGAWTFKSNGADARLTFEWAESKKFLIARFTLKQEGRTTTGVQVLALDPATRSLRSWTFESDGSLGEAVWTRTEKGWTAKSTGVTSDGEKSRATTVLTPTDVNAFTWQSIDRTIDGERVPDIGPVQVVREGKGA